LGGTSFLRNCGFFKTSIGGIILIRKRRKTSPIQLASIYLPKKKNNVTKTPWMKVTRRIMKKLYLLEEKYKRKKYNTHDQKHKTIKNQKFWSKNSSDNNNT
jgi:hypothetical protein